MTGFQQVHQRIDNAKPNLIFPFPNKGTDVCRVGLPQAILYRVPVDFKLAFRQYVKNKFDDNAKESDLKRILTLIEDDEEDIQV